MRVRVRSVRTGLSFFSTTLLSRDFSEIAGFAFVQNNHDVSPLQADNARTLTDLLEIPFVGAMPYCPGLGKRLPVSPAVAGLLAQALPGLAAWYDAPPDSPADNGA